MLYIEIRETLRCFESTLDSSGEKLLAVTQLLSMGTKWLEAPTALSGPSLLLGME